MTRELTNAEADTVMANIDPMSRRWCVISCGPFPGYEAGALTPSGCACIGCIYGALSWEDFAAWKEREARRDPTPYIELIDDRPLDIMQRLAAYKQAKRAGG